MSKEKLCDACKNPVAGGYSIGGTILCRECYPLVSAEVERLHREDKPVDAMQIAQNLKK